MNPQIEASLKAQLLTELDVFLREFGQKHGVQAALRLPAYQEDALRDGLAVREIPYQGLILLPVIQELPKEQLPSPIPDDGVSKSEAVDKQKEGNHA